jgi:nucleotide-binding universal stress UspA family protein
MSDAPADAEMDVIPATVVTPLDGSEFSGRAVPVAVDTARRMGADLVVTTTPLTLVERGAAAVPTWLEDVAATVDYPRTKAVLCEDLDPVHGISMLVAQSDTPVVCMATHGRGALGTAALGSVAQQIVREVGVPVLLVGRHCDTVPPTHGPIVVCHDGSEPADAVLGPARAWAHALDLPIVLVHAYHALDVATATATPERIDAAAAFLGSQTRVELLRSSYPAGAIRNTVEEVGASLVALSTHGRSGLARMTLGSVAMTVVRQSPCPALVTRPMQLASAPHAIREDEDEQERT